MNDYDKSLDQTMIIKLLKAPLIIKNFISGETACNYEYYLLELLNLSSWFECNFPGEFHRPESENHGECDAKNKNYEIDFKLFSSKTSLRARSVLSPQISKLTDAVVGYGVSKDRGEILATRLHVAFRGKTLTELESLRSSQIKKAGFENDIINVLEILETQKNILLFFPFSFSFTEPHKYEEAIASITKGIENDFLAAFEYRNKYANEYDTFFCCIYDEKFLIFSIQNNALLWCDSVSTHSLPTYCKLDEYADW